jgi:hypothetical protein
MMLLSSLFLLRHCEFGALKKTPQNGNSGLLSRYLCIGQNGYEKRNSL